MKIGDAFQTVDVQSASTSATIDVTGISSAFKIYRIDFYDVQPDVDNRTFAFEIGTGATPTYPGANQVGAALSFDDAGTDKGIISIGATQILLSINTSGDRVGATGSEGLAGFVELWNPSGGSFTRGRFETNYTDTTGVNIFYRGNWVYEQTTAVTAVRFKFTADNIETGTFVTTGRR